MTKAEVLRRRQIREQFATAIQSYVVVRGMIDQLIRRERKRMKQLLNAR
jgi:hypothetical protein